MSISFDPARHTDMVDVLTRASRSLEDVLGALDLEVDALREGWSGTAREAYERAHSDWSESLRTLKAALRAATSAAQDAGEVLAKADQDATALWK